jgi:hypothetical protein
VALKIPLLPLLSNFHILTRRFLRFLLKSVEQNHPVALGGRGQDPIDVPGIFRSNLPQLLIAQLTPEFRQDYGECPQHFKIPHYFRPSRRF